MTILFQPSEIAPVGNPIAYQVSGSGVLFLLKLSVETELYSNVFEEVITLDGPADSAGSATFELHTVLKGCLAHDLPNLTATTAFLCKQLCKRYKVAIAELQQGDLVDSAVFTEQPVRFAILASFPWATFPGRSTDIPSTGSLLTTKPLTRRISREQADFVTFISSTDTTLTATFTVLYTDGTSDLMVKNFGAVRKFEPAIVPIGFSAQDYAVLSLGRSIRQISVAFGASVVTLIPFSANYLRNVREFYFWTTGGAFESLVCTGESSQATEHTGEEFQHYVPYNYTLSNPVYRTYNNSLRSSGKVATGFFRSAGEFEAAREIFNNLQVREREGSLLLPIVVTSKKSEGRNSQEALLGFEFEYKRAF